MMDDISSVAMRVMMKMMKKEELFPSSTKKEALFIFQNYADEGGIPLDPKPDVFGLSRSVF
jgi:hypothetical protein